MKSTFNSLPGTVASAMNPFCFRAQWILGDPSSFVSHRDFRIFISALAENYAAFLAASTSETAFADGPSFVPD
jgi:hypothetical protein